MKSIFYKAKTLFFFYIFSICKCEKIVIRFLMTRIIKNKRVFPTYESVFKVLYLGINNISKK